MPAAPVDFTAERRGGEVKVQFTVPSANTDGTKPANVERVEVYRFTGPTDALDDQLLKLGTRVATVPVRAPRNPDITTEPDEPTEEPDLEDEGLDQGWIAQLEDELGPTAFQAVDLPKARRSRTRDVATPVGPLVGPPASVPSATYVAVGFSKRGRKGPLSRRVAVPLVFPPRAPSPPAVSYDEKTIHITWTPAADVVPVQQATAGDALPSRFIGMAMPTIGYHLYDVSPSATPIVTNTRTPPFAGLLRLTEKPVLEPRYDDSRIEWGTTRCYTVRTVETFGDATIESDAPPPLCTTLRDSFPPAAPKDLTAVAGEHAINLIWAPNNEPDLAGYIVLRGVSSGETLDRATPEPATEPRFTDSVQPGIRYVYAVRAIDKAGNIGPMSNRADETAR